VDTYLDTFYLAIITITTVGYGDLTCQSLFGRWTCCVAALHGTFIVSYIVVTGSSRFELSKKEAQVAFQVQSSNRSIDTIKRMFKFFMAKKQFYVHMLAMDETLY
jgi:glycerate kinase